MTQQENEDKDWFEIYEEALEELTRLNQEREKTVKETKKS